MKHLFKQPLFYATVLSLSLVGLIIASYVLGWTIPTQNPPNGNITLRTGTGTNPAGSTGYIQFNAGSGALGGDANLFWDNTNKRLGIGTTTPDSQLTIYRHDDNYPTIKLINDNSDAGGQIILGSASAPNAIRIVADTNGDPGIYFDYYGVISSDQGDLYIDAPNIILGSYLSDGNVGIGASPPPAAKLDVGGVRLGFSCTGDYWVDYYLGQNADPNPGDIILLIPNPSGTVNAAMMEGTITASRGATGAVRLLRQWHITVSRAYTDLGGSITPLSEDEPMIKLVTCNYQGMNYLGIDTSAAGPSAQYWKFSGSYVNCLGGQRYPVLVSRSSCTNITDFKTYHSLGSQISISSTGNVGIRTTIPAAGLDINEGSTNNVALALRSSGVGWGSGVQFINSASGAKNYGLYAGSDGKWHFVDVSSSIDRMIIDSSGNVGIGTTVPGAKLDVAGAIKIGTQTICDVNSAGAIRYDSTQKKFYGCNGTSWVSLEQQSCGYPVTFNYKGSTVTYGTVYSPATGRCWLDRNLGASRVATAYNDSAAYGDLFQWGRLGDGHQTRTSGTTTTLSSTDVPGHSNFILAPNSPYDWRSPENDNLWQGVNGINNPCPPGWRIPTLYEWDAERASWSQWNYNGAFASPLKLTAGGERSGSNGTLGGEGQWGSYWSDAGGQEEAGYLLFDASVVLLTHDQRAIGRSVRCIKD